jgi:hypothetical protein
MAKKAKLEVKKVNIANMDTSWTTQVLVIGAIVGALTGLGGAYLLIQRAKNRNETPSLDAKEGLRLGLLVFGLLRQVAMLGEDD